MLLEAKKIHLLCLENTHNYAGGICFSKKQLADICSLARKHNVPIHLDGARVLNAATFFNIPVSELVDSVDTVMFCLSKGLGAPVGSVLCGSHHFILDAKNTRKFLGGTMRQAGVLASAGIVAIQGGKNRLEEDHENALLLAEKIKHNDTITVNVEDVQTNIIRMDVSQSGIGAKTFQESLVKRGVRTNVITENLIRMVTYREIQKKDIIEVSNIINGYCESL